MKLILIRHGATNSNQYGRYLGRTDEELSPEGIRQLLEKKQAGCYPEVSILASSPMKRCVQTAMLIYGQVPLLQIEEWKEIDFGMFEGKTYRELDGDEDYQRWIDSGGIHPFPGGEGREEFVTRCGQGLTRFCHMLQSGSCIPQSAALVVHGGTIMSVLSAFGEGDYFDFQCRNGEGYCCELHLECELRIDRIQRLSNGKIHLGGNADSPGTG